MSPRRKSPSARATNVLADVRDCLTLFRAPEPTPNLASFAGQCALLASQVIDPIKGRTAALHIDESVASDYRATMLEIATVACAAVIEHDRLVTDARKAVTA